MTNDILERAARAMRRIVDETFLFPHSGDDENCPRCRIYAIAMAALSELEAALTPPQRQGGQ